jgi:hypothetical protein
MEILRVPPYPVTATWTLPAVNTSYIAHVEDVVDHSFEDQTVTSDSSGVVTLSFTQDKLKYDRNLTIKFYDSDHEEVVLESDLDIVRPYVNPADLATSGTASEILEYKKYEVVARAIIDMYSDFGFYNKKTAIQTAGSGTDYTPVWKNVNSVLKVYENDVLVFDADAQDPTTNLYQYSVTPDRSAIYQVNSESSNALSSRPINLPTSRGDLAWGVIKYGIFNPNYNYTFIVEEGFRSIPSDIEKAITMLIDDLKCGRLDYYQKYVTSYNTDQFRIQFDKKMLEGTGNLIVDKILDKYEKSITRVGVL